MISAESLKGKKVISASGDDVGKVENVEINVANWVATNIHINLYDDAARKLGYAPGLIGRSKPVIVLPVQTIDQIGDEIILKNDIKEIQELEASKTKQSLTIPATFDKTRTGC